jgi:hypothetical protein
MCSQIIGRLGSDTVTFNHIQYETQNAKWGSPNNPGKANNPFLYVT